MLQLRRMRNTTALLLILCWVREFFFTYFKTLQYKGWIDFYLWLSPFEWGVNHAPPTQNFLFVYTFLTKTNRIPAEAAVLNFDTLSILASGPDAAASLRTRLKPLYVTAGAQGTPAVWAAQGLDRKSGSFLFLSCSVLFLISLLISIL